MQKPFSIISSFAAGMMLLLFAACSADKPTLFTLMDNRTTGVDFKNELNLTDTFNILDYLYYYNGGGVAVGDLDNDGLPDLYFTANRGSNKLYKNKGNLQFEDVTEIAGVAGKGNWKTGVTLADVNGDGLLDIYVCAVGGYKSLQGRNQLFINQGNLRFSEEAAAYGLDVEGFNTQASFFDYDKDGDLDMFLVNHSVHSVESYGDSSIRTKTAAASGDKLFRNNGAGATPRFTEVTESAGIYSSALGYGLNVLTADFTGDGWDDIYVSNDFHEHDYYYVNQRDGTFKELSRAAFGHQSRFSMGADMADINGDGWLDIITLDMLPEDEKVLKSSAGDDPLDIYEFKFSRGYHHQYARNCLQLNGGNGASFQEIGLFAGVSATDWSWSPLLADFNNDGIRDLFVSNGIPKRPNDLDYIKYISDGNVSASLQTGKSADAKAISAMPGGVVPNVIYEGSKTLQFIQRSTDWGFTVPSVSNGAVAADLDGDGDLDIVLNNLDAPASIYRNNSEAQTKANYVTIQLAGTDGNTAAFGTAVTIWYDGQQQFATSTATRGFQSAAATPLHFGLGAINKIDSMIVRWPNGMEQRLYDLQVNRTILVKQSEANIKAQSNTNSVTPVFTNASDLIPEWKHRENTFFDYNVQQLIPHAISTAGPKIAVADVNGDGLDDFFVCGGAGQPALLCIQDASGKWQPVKQPAFEADSPAEDVSAVFFDADGDGEKDLYVVAGGNELHEANPLLHDRLYLNNGKGVFVRKEQATSFGGNRSVVCAADVDGDGDLDLFVGSRAVAGRYGETPRSHLLLNDGKGNFSEAQDNLAPGLKTIGMVNDAVWTDIDRDGWPDLAIVGEWMPLTIFKNKKGKLNNETASLGLAHTTGLWTAIGAADINGDGWPELLGGNRGLNSKLNATVEAPLLLYTGDVDGNGSVDHLLAVNKGGRYFPFLGKEELEKAMPSFIRKRYSGYGDMAGQTMEQIFRAKLDNMQRFTAENLASVLIENKEGKLKLTPLPAPLQWSPVFSFAVQDLNGDGVPELFTGGNYFGAIPFEGRYDAGGVQMLSGGLGGKVLPPAHSGLPIFTEVRDIKFLRKKGGKTYLLVAANNGPLQLFALL